MPKAVSNELINRELSWLSFNARVLQEAENKNVPLLERLKFLAIFSSNLDEFFRVRVASNHRLYLYQVKTKSKEVKKTEALLKKIQQITVDWQETFNNIYEHQIKAELAAENIYIVNETQLSISQAAAIKQFYRKEVLSNIFPVILDHLRVFPFLRDKSIYLAVKMSHSSGQLRTKYALIEVPSEVINRFYILPKTDENTYIILLDDVIRISLPEIFSSLDYDTFEAYTIKLTRDAELEIDNDVSESLISRISNSLKARYKGKPVRFIYDENMPEDLLAFIIKKNNFAADSMIPGGRYHNFKDFMDFPSVGPESFKYQPTEPIAIKAFKKVRSLFEAIKEQDLLLHHPYHSFDYVIRLLREAAIDPSVYAIKITLYRVAKHSNVVNALINAVKNGKDVTVVIELQARFDEESNLYWTNRLQEAGATVVLGVPDYKIHAKLCVIFRKENNKTVHYLHMSTGNYNGRTSRLYSDSALLTCDPRLTKDAVKVFSFIKNFPKIQYRFNNLLVTPYYMKMEFLKLIDIEIRNAKKKKEAFIYAKMNSLVDEMMINKLYEASNAGVQIRLIIRGICCLNPGVIGQSENIKVISILDKYLEHARYFFFANDKKLKVFMSSADWMSRNLDRRIETAFPILDKNLQQQLLDIFNIQWSDNTRARIINSEQNNQYVEPGIPLVRAQFDTYSYLKDLLEN